MEKITTTTIIDVQTGQAEENVGNLRTQIKKLRDELVQLEEGTEEYNSTAQKLGNLMHQQSEAMEMAKLSTDDFGQKMSNTATILNGGIGAITAVTSSLSLMGIEMGDDTKLMKTLVSAMALTNAIRDIDDAAKAFKGMGAAIKGAKNAQQALNAAFKANPIGLVVGAVVGLIAVLGSLINKAKEVKELAQQEAYDKESKTYNDYLKELENVDNLPAIKRLEAAGATTEEIIRKKQEEIIRINNAAAESWKESVRNQNQMSDEQRKELNELGKSFTALYEKKTKDYELELELSKIRDAKAKKEKANADALKAQQDAEQKRLKELAEQEEYRNSLPSIYDKQRNTLRENYLNGLITELDYKKEILAVDLAEWNAQPVTLKATQEAQVAKLDLLEREKAIQLELYELTKQSELDALNVAKSNLDNNEASATLNARQQFQINENDTDDIRLQKQQALEDAIYNIQFNGVQRRLDLLEMEHTMGLLSDEEYNSNLINLETKKQDLLDEQSERNRQRREAEAESTKQIQELLRQQQEQFTSNMGSLLGALADN